MQAIFVATALCKWKSRFGGAIACSETACWVRHTTVRVLLKKDVRRVFVASPHHRSDSGGVPRKQVFSPVTLIGRNNPNETAAFAAC